MALYHWRMDRFAVVDRPIRHSISVIRSTQAVHRALQECKLVTASWAVCVLNRPRHGDCFDETTEMEEKEREREWLVCFEECCDLYWNKHKCMNEFDGIQSSHAARNYTQNAAPGVHFAFGSYKTHLRSISSVLLTGPKQLFPWPARSRVCAMKIEIGLVLGSRHAKHTPNAELMNYKFVQLIMNSIRSICSAAVWIGKYIDNYSYTVIQLTTAGAVFNAFLTNRVEWLVHSLASSIVHKLRTLFSVVQFSGDNFRRNTVPWQGDRKKRQKVPSHSVGGSAVYLYSIEPATMPSLSLILSSQSN